MIPIDSFPIEEWLKACKLERGYHNFDLQDDNFMRLLRLSMQHMFKIYQQENNPTSDEIIKFLRVMIMKIKKYFEFPTDKNDITKDKVDYIRKLNKIVCIEARSSFGTTRFDKKEFEKFKDKKYRPVIKEDNSDEILRDTDSFMKLLELEKKYEQMIGVLLNGNIGIKGKLLLYLVTQIQEQNKNGRYIEVSLVDLGKKIGYRNYKKTEYILKMCKSLSDNGLIDFTDVSRGIYKISMKHNKSWAPTQ